MPWDVILGGITGLIGSCVTAISNFKTQKLKNEHDEKMYDFKIQELGAKTDAAIKITEAKISGAVELADSAAYTESQKASTVKYVSDSWIEKLFSMTGYLSWISVPVGLLLAMALGFVDFLKGLMRPGLTLYLTAATSWVTYTAYKLVQQSETVVSITESLAIYNRVIDIVIYLTVSCITWWFADRRMAKFLMRLNDGNTKTNQIINVPK